VNKKLLVKYGWFKADTDTETEQNRRRKFMENIGVAAATDVIIFILYVLRRAINS